MQAIQCSAPIGFGQFPAACVMIFMDSFVVYASKITISHCCSNPFAPRNTTLPEDQPYVFDGPIYRFLWSNREKKIVCNRLPLCHGAQLAVDATIVSPLAWECVYIYI